MLAERLLLDEEAAGEQRTNRVRLVLAPVLAGLLFANSLQRGVIGISDRISFIAVGVFFLYSLLMYFGLRTGRYRSSFKFVSVAIEMLLVAVTMAAHQFDAPPVAARVFSAGRAAVFFLFIALSGLRYSFRLSLQAGILAAVFYSGSVLLNLPAVFRGDFGAGLLNPLLATGFHFGTNGSILHHSLFNELVKVMLFIVTGTATGIVSRNARRLLEQSSRSEDTAGIVQAQHRLATLAEREARKYLANVGEGLLSFGRNMVIKEQYSAAVRTILGARRVDGVRFPEFILPNPHDPRHAQLTEFLDLLFNNTTADFEMLAEINPLKEMEFFLPDGELRHLAISFKRIPGDGHEVAELMAMISDITELVLSRRRLGEEKRRHQSDMEMITAILHADLDDFEIFTAEGKKSLERIQSILDTLLVLPAGEIAAAVNTAFREAHTLKGNARNYGFAMIADEAHKAEDQLAVLRDGGADAFETALPECRKRFLELQEAFAQLMGLGEKFADFSQSRAFGRDDTGSPVERFRDYCAGVVAGLAGDLGKEIGFELVAPDPAPPRQLLDALRDPLGHLLRNAADHGLETPAERAAAGKTPRSLIRLVFACNDGGCRVTLQDDGRGVDCDAVLTRAVERGLVPAGTHPPREKLLGLLFHPGFSTRDSASAHSGRGVGLDAVRARVKELGGRIEIKTAPGKGTVFTLLMPLTEDADS